MSSREDQSKPLVGVVRFRVSFNAINWNIVSFRSAKLNKRDGGLQSADLT